MGYETELQFTGVIIDNKRLQLFRTYVEKNRGNDSRAFHYMLQYLYLETNEHGYLDWNLSKDQKKQLKWLSGERPVPIHSIDFDKVDFVFVNFGVEGETVGKWYESDAFVEWLSSYCMGGRIVEISREGDGEISNYSATPRSEQHSPPWLIAEKLGTLSVPGGNAEVFEQGKDVLTDRFIMLIKLHRHNQIRELAPLWPVVGRE